MLITVSSFQFVLVNAGFDCKYFKFNNSFPSVDSTSCVVSSTHCVHGDWTLWVISRTSTRQTPPSSPHRWSHGSWTHCTETRGIKLRDDLNLRDSSSRSVSLHDLYSCPVELVVMDVTFFPHLLGEDRERKAIGAA